MAKSLLAHLYTHIKGSQEDIATMSLQYLLMQSKDLNRAFTRRVADVLCVKVQEELRYSTQVTGEDKERPDMAGVDNNGKEQILFEMKFYAALTKNQPVAYLERLKKENGKGLVFICPESRMITLWATLKDLCKEKEVTVIDEFCVKVDGINLAIITWSEILELLRKTASSTAIDFLSDIDQLSGYCLQIDSDAFIPFTEDDLKADVSKKAERYYSVIDKVTQLLLYDDKLESSKKGLKATANRYGYISYIYVNDYALGVCYDRYFWERNSSVETPFWLLVKNRDWEQNEKILTQLKRYPETKIEEYYGDYYLALDVPTNVTEAEVCDNIKEQILKCITDIDNK